MGQIGQLKIIYIQKDVVQKKKEENLLRNYTKNANIQVQWVWFLGIK